MKATLLKALMQLKLKNLAVIAIIWYSTSASPVKRSSPAELPYLQWAQYMLSTESAAVTTMKMPNA